MQRENFVDFVSSFAAHCIFIQRKTLCIFVSLCLKLFHQIQYQIIDRTSFRQFLGIHTVAEIPDEKTVWACRDKLGKAGTFDLLFDKFRAYLDSLGLSFNEGKIIDATFVEAPRQRNTHEEHKQIKDGNGASLWQSEDGDSENEKKRKAHKRSHKDIDAHWTKKRGENHYGYKAHVKADKKTKLIEKYHTTDASVHDSNVIEPLIEEKDKEVTVRSRTQGALSSTSSVS